MTARAQEGYERNLFYTATRQLFCWIDEYFGMSMADIEEYENATFAEATEQTKLVRPAPDLARFSPDSACRKPNLSFGLLDALSGLRLEREEEMEGG